MHQVVSCKKHGYNELAVLNYLVEEFFIGYYLLFYYQVLCWALVCFICNGTPVSVGSVSMSGHISTGTMTDVCLIVWAGSVCAEKMQLTALYHCLTYVCLHIIYSVAFEQTPRFAKVSVCSDMSVHFSHNELLNNTLIKPSLLLGF